MATLLSQSCSRHIRKSSGVAAFTSPRTSHVGGRALRSGRLAEYTAKKMGRNPRPDWTGSPLTDARQSARQIESVMSRHKEWYELPGPAAIARLIGIRDELRRENLFDTEDPPHGPREGAIPEDASRCRTSDGTNNDLSIPLMGSTGTRFGRNVPLSEAFPDRPHLFTPNPRTVSRELLTRTTFQPATTLNVLAAAWIQFQVHDWFKHQTGVAGDAHHIPLGDDDPWPERPMLVPKTPIDPAIGAGSTRPPAYINEGSHWWDGSQIYGSTDAVQQRLRTQVDGKVRVDSSGRLEVDPRTGLELTGLSENLWVGLSLLHGLFALEHNAICDRLKHAYPGWNDARVFQHARLINAALMAKIHTVEWTPAILPNPITKVALQTNWAEILGSPTDHHRVPYSLTEEFVAVYRMHSLIPDEFAICSASDGSKLGQFELPSLTGRRGRELLEQFRLSDLFYSFGIAHPGALRLHNFPQSLQHLQKDTGEHLDLAAVDILRDRERGLPRYNRFRRLIHKTPVTSFAELSDNPEWAAEIERVYDGNLELVDLLVGLMAEPLPAGFGFSDTAFRIFVLMASRRLKSDRFLSADFRPQIYTPLGVDWVERTTMVDVLERHFPDLSPALAGVDNAFQPWTHVRGPAGMAAPAGPPAV